MRKVVISIAFLIVIVSMSACRSTCSCAANEKQEINLDQAKTTSIQKAEV